MSRRVNFTPYVDRQFDFTSGKKRLPGSTPDEPFKTYLEAKEDEYSGATADKPFMKME